jgi:hypothetical protein
MMDGKFFTAGEQMLPDGKGQNGWRRFFLALSNKLTGQPSVFRESASLKG